MKRRIDKWLPSYILDSPRRWYHRVKRRNAHTHLLFLVCDHFEPRHAATSNLQGKQRVQAWSEGYAAFQLRCKAEFGTTPVHSWFYPPHHGVEHLSALSAMAFEGLGEVELHYHHGNDTAETLEKGLKDTIAEYNRWGLLLNSGEVLTTSFGFIHGDWALGNSGHQHHCGVNDELTILQKLGCWADLTMPSGDLCQTSKINSIYYGIGSPQRPKAHDHGVNVCAGSLAPPGLMMIQGPLAVNWSAEGHPRIENASLTTENWGRPDRISKWIDCNVHVNGQPDWVFIKLHTHGAMEHDFDALFGEKAMALHRQLNNHYNDGKKYTLHYVTARQAFNIAKAAEQGHKGNPSDFVDFRISPPVTAFYQADGPHTLLACSKKRLHIVMIDSDKSTSIRTRIGPFAVLRGKIQALEIDVDKRLIKIDGIGLIRLIRFTDVNFSIMSGGRAVSNSDSCNDIEISGLCILSYQ